jgi:predicted DNA-binding protein with PD1-like motif
LEENEDVLATLEAIAEKEKIQGGFFFIVGSLKKGSLVSGAETECIPIFPIWYHVQNNHEVLGIGNIFQMNG